MVSKIEGVEGPRQAREDGVRDSWRRALEKVGLLLPSSWFRTHLLYALLLLSKESQDGAKLREGVLKGVHNFHS